MADELSTGTFEASFEYIDLILMFYGTAKLGDTYKYFKISVTLWGMLVKKSPLRIGELKYKLIVDAHRYPEKHFRQT
jgi:hypothetical protein